MNTNILKTLVCGLSVAAIFACSKLDREPLDNIGPNKYYKTSAQLETFTLNQYSAFPASIGSYSGGMATWDNGTDNQAGGGPNLTMFTQDEWKVAANGELGFGAIRDLNYFINEVEEKMKTPGAIEGSADDIKHCLGEAYFFRAYRYFDKLQAYGDYPIVTQVLPDDNAVLQEHAKRQPRNKVARFILADLDKAYELLKATYPANQRLTKKVARLFKSRVALYEGTFEKYHRGSGRVPGDATWLGKDKEWNKEFSINQDEEVNFFLDEAMKSAKEVADVATLTQNSHKFNPENSTHGWNPYFELFGTKDLARFPEALLWRQHSRTVNIVHHTSNRLTTGIPAGWTRSLVESFLTAEGKPYYKKVDKDDSTIAKVKEGRDERLKLFMFAEGDVLKMTQVPFVPFEVALFLENAESREPTGYRPRKGLNYDPTNLAGGGVNDESGLIYFRSAEALLNYIEASYIRKGQLDGDAVTYWTKLRERAGVTGTVQATIAATDMAIEANVERPSYDWGAFSAGKPIDATLYSIRRERRCEFAGEGFRWDDLVRWCAMDQVKNYHIEGCNFWDKIHTYEYFKKADPNNPGKKLNESSIIADGSDKANMSAKELTKYVRPYQKFNSANNRGYNGYTFYKAHYLHPFSSSELRYCSPTNDAKNSNLYQNPGWGTEGDTHAQF